ncbi:MAG: DUF499 domain-containing protein [Clostridia bacterium]|nr:DUF499 domain-containing protein [Clostridia bacterium]
MKTVRDSCQLHPNALSIKLSDQIEQLDELINQEGDGTDFFEKTFITDGMKTLITEGIARLAGKSSQAIFHLKQAMGGGKTHLLVGFGLLAKNPSLRKKYCPDVLNIDLFDSASIAAFNGRNNPDHFFWGEIAKQLNKPEIFKKFWEAGPKAPDERDWLELFEGENPIAILLDEMPPYFHYLNTQQIGNGTVADIATRAFANMLTAAGKKKNVCVVVSDLTAAYDTGGKLINKALDDARSEIGRQERSITPVDLSANEIYEILKKRLFISLPPKNIIDEIARAFANKLAEAAKSKTIRREAEAIADEIANTYPFHPRLKNLIALFKENEQFKQTRGIIELVSRLLKSVWERKENDVFLIGPQHFDLSIPEVRDKLTEISGMRDVIAKDIWDINHSAHAQIVDSSKGKDAATQVATLLFTASLSTAVNAVKGLTKEEMIECLLSPLREPSDFITAFEDLEKVAWYLHKTPEGKFYFDRQENLTKLLQSLANDAPENQIDDLIRHRLAEMFHPQRKTAYEEVLPLPRLEDVVEAVRKKRVLIIHSPDSKIPPEEITRFFDGLTQKNNILVLTGDKSAMASVEQAARQFYAAQKADLRIPKGHPQREDLERKQAQYEHHFTTTILGLFDKLLFPVQLPGCKPELRSKPLDQTRDSSKQYNGEEQIEKTLVSTPQKLFLDVEKEFDLLREKAENILWPENQDDTRWSDASDRYAEIPAMPWLPPRGLNHLKAIALNRGIWEDLGNGYITKKPKKKKTSAQIVPEHGPDDEGYVRLKINPVNAGPAPKIYYSEDSPVSESNKLLQDNILTTKALKVQFLVCDPTGTYETGDPVEWKNTLKLRTSLIEKGNKRFVELYVAPKGEIRYTLDGSEPRNGNVYTQPIEIGDGEVLLRAFAQANGLETKEDFRFTAKGKEELEIDETKPAKLKTKSVFKLDSRQSTFECIKLGIEKSIEFENVNMTLGQGSKIATIILGEMKVDSKFLQDILSKLCELFSPEEPITMTFKIAHFKNGVDFKDFCSKLQINLKQDNIEQ